MLVCSVKQAESQDLHVDELGQHQFKAVPGGYNQGQHRFLQFYGTMGLEMRLSLCVSLLLHQKPYGTQPPAAVFQV